MLFNEEASWQPKSKKNILACKKSLKKTVPYMTVTKKKEGVYALRN